MERRLPPKGTKLLAAPTRLEDGDRKKLTALLASRPEFTDGNARGRRVFLEQAGLAMFLINADLSGAPGTVAGDIVGRLERHGRLRDRASHHALALLILQLQALPADLAQGEEDFLGGLMGRYNLITQEGGDSDRIIAISDDKSESVAAEPPSDRSSGPCDVFLSYNSADQVSVEAIAHWLRGEQITPWFGPWDLVPGVTFQEEIEDALDRCACVAVFVGPSGIGDWQKAEMRIAIERRIASLRAGGAPFRVIPVLLPQRQKSLGEQLPSFLLLATWVEFHNDLNDPSALRALIAGIRGQPPGPGTYNARTDEQLLTLAIELNWDLANWGAAHSAAADLHNISPELSEAWIGLTQAAQHFQLGRTMQGKAELNALRERFHGHQKIDQMIVICEQRFQRDALRTLLADASQTLAQENDDGYVRAAQKYAEALALAPQDPRVLAGLQEVGNRLGPGIRIRCQQAQGIRFQATEESLQRATEMYATLSAIQSVSTRLGLGKDLAVLLEETVERLGPKLETWKAVHQSLLDTTRQIDEALRHPIPIDHNSSTPGGWIFQEARRTLEEIQRRAMGPQDDDCRRLIQDKRNALSTLETTARDLEERIRPFLVALYNEDFDAIAREADALASQWQRAIQQKQGHWEGIDQLLRYHYPKHNRDVDQLEEHKRLAAGCTGNLNQWRTWSADATRTYNTAKTKAQKVMSGTFSEVRGRQSLAELARLCQECVQACDEFDREVNSEPEVPPLSLKAENEKEKVAKEAWVTEVMGSAGYRAKAATLYSQAQSEQKKLEDPLQKLRQTKNNLIDGFMNNPRNRGKSLPPSSISRVRAELQVCIEIDPLQEEVVRINRQIRALIPSG
jgi:hypothetical protein